MAVGGYRQTASSTNRAYQDAASTTIAAAKCSPVEINPYGSSSTEAFSRSDTQLQQRSVRVERRPTEFAARLGGACFQRLTRIPVGPPRGVRAFDGAQAESAAARGCSLAGCAGGNVR